MLEVPVWLIDARGMLLGSRCEECAIVYFVYSLLCVVSGVEMILNEIAKAMAVAGFSIREGRSRLTLGQLTVMCGFWMSVV